MFLSDLFKDVKELLQKARPAGKGFVPEKSDIGEPHPTDKNQIGHVSKLNQIVWSHKPKLVESQENNIKRYGHTANLSPSGSAKAAALYYHLHNDPDKGVMAGGTTTGHQGDFKELRMRHLHNAIMKRPGSSIKEDKNGIIIEADRHSGNEKNSGSSTTWHWDGKTLKSFHENPISGNTSEGSYTYDKLGKSYRANGRGIFEGRGLGRLRLRFAGRLRVSRGGGKLLSAPPESGQEGLKKAVFLSDIIDDSWDLLVKSRADDIKAALGPHADWANKTLAYDDNGKTKVHAPHIDWLATAVSKDPAALTEAKKADLANYADKYHLPEVKNAKLQGKSLDAGLNELNLQEREGLRNQAKKKGHVTPKGEILQPTKTGKAWHNLGVAGCAEEGNAGGHCGNGPALDSRPHERVLSLREPTKRADTLKQHLTFINSDGYITESKGKFNTKPKSEYHSDIIDLLENPSIKGYVGGGYLPGSNFEPDDIKDPEQKQRLKDLEAKKPGFFTPDVDDLHETIRNDPFLPMHVTNKAERADRKTKKAELTPKERADMMERATGNRPGSYGHARLSSHPRISPEAAMHLATVSPPNSGIHESLADNDNISPEAAMHLATANEPNSRTQRNLAVNPSIGADVIAYLAKVNAVGLGPTDMHYRLATNPNISPETAMHMAKVNEPDSDTHRFLARNRKISPEVAMHLATVNEPDSVAHHVMARNPNISPEVAMHLAKVNELGSEAHRNLADNDNLNPEVAAYLAEVSHPDSSTHRTLARNPNITPELGMHLANIAGTDRDGDPISDSETHRSLAYNPNISPELAMHLAKVNHTNSYIHEVLARNPGVNAETLSHLAKVTEGRKDAYRNMHGYESDVERALRERPVDQEDHEAKEAAYLKTIKDAQVLDENGVAQEAYDGAAEAQQKAAESLNKLRRNNVIRKIKEPGADIDFIKRYEFSHDLAASNAAKKALKDKGMKKSEALAKSDGTPARPLTSHRLIHDTLDKIHAKHGTRIGNTTAADLLSLVERGDLERLHKHMAAAGYGNNPKHTISQLRAILISPKQRQAFHQGMPSREAKKSHSRLAKSWRAMLGACKEMRSGL